MPIRMLPLWWLAMDVGSHDGEAHEESAVQLQCLCIEQLACHQQRVAQLVTQGGRRTKHYRCLRMVDEWMDAVSCGCSE